MVHKLLLLYLQLAPWHAMLAEGVIDRHITLAPMLEGFVPAEHMHWTSAALFDNKVCTMHPLRLFGSCLLLYVHDKVAAVACCVLPFWGFAHRKD